MRMRVAENWLSSLLAAGLLASPLAAQELTTPNSPPAAEASTPVYSLVAVGDVSTMQSGIRFDCSQSICIDSLSFGSFQSARTLTGPDLGEHFGATIMVHGSVRGEAMLVVVQRFDDGALHVVARGRWNELTGSACVDQAALDTLNFHPSGEGILQTDYGVCAELRPTGQTNIVLEEPVEAINAWQYMTPSIMIVEFERPARYIGEPQVCPGASPDDDPAEVLCMASLYQERARVLRHLAGPRLPARIRLRTTTHSFVGLLRPGNAIVVEVTPFNDNGTEGYFASWWQSEDEWGRICLDEDTIAELGVERQFRSGRRQGWHDPTSGETSWSRCIRV